MQDKNNIRFSAKGSNGIGIITIEGLVFPEHKFFDPLGGLWAKMRKIVRKNTGVDSTGIFAYDTEQKLISCSFILNTAILEKGSGKQEQEEYQKKFEEIFPQQAEFFEQTILRFINEDYYRDYCQTICSRLDNKQKEKAIKGLLKKFTSSLMMDFDTPL
ncbi:MAG: hypothetical protein Q4B29_00875 [Candidatus Saccharibacteria bacterium]|nr:hypothetical protein [Candidatus Saccharibacteria bacterium]